MSEALQMVLRYAEYAYPPRFSCDEMEDWPKGEAERLETCGLLRAAPAAEAILCHDCGELEDIVILDDYVNKRPIAYLRCETYGASRIPLERLRQWDLSFQGLMDMAFADVDLVGQREEIVPERVWRLGKASLGGASRNVYFARALHRRDAWQVIDQAALSPRSVVFVPAKTPQDEDDDRTKVKPLILPPTMAISQTANGIGLDHEYVEAEISATAAFQDANFATRPPARKRDARTGVVDALTRAMDVHLSGRAPSHA
jgi:hypothetical protein